MICIISAVALLFVDVCMTRVVTITFGRLSSLPPGSEIQISLVEQRILLRPDQHVILEKEAMRRVNISTCLGMCFSLYFLIK